MNSVNHTLTSDFVLPVYCSQPAYNQCMNTPLTRCVHCSSTRAVLLLFCLSLLGVSVIVANALVIASLFHTKPTGRKKVDYVKSSLALADILSGLDALFVAVRLGGLYLRHTVAELIEMVISSRGTLAATFAGILFFSGYTLSVYHLLYMSVQRLVAVRFPFWYRRLQARKVVMHMIVVWCWAILWSSSMLYIYGDTYQFMLSASVFRYFPYFSSPQLSSDFIRTHVVPTILVYFVPYAAMMVITTGAAVMAWKERRKSNRLRSASAHDRSRELHLIKITVLMEISFTIGIVPTTVEYLLTYAGILPSTQHPVAFMVCYFLLVSTGLFNVLIYSVYDESFRECILHYRRTWKNTLSRAGPHEIDQETT